MDMNIDTSYESPRWSNEIVDCSMPMTFDTYSNCAFGCQYCFSRFRRSIGNAKDKYLEKQVASVNVDAVKKMFLEPDKYAKDFAEYIKNRKVMQWGGLSDEFDGFERKYGKTLQLLKFFKEIDYPICFSTKSTWWTKDERYMELIRGQKNWNFKFSIITLDEQKAKIVEQGVPSPAERLKAIERIVSADAGGATLRLRPFIIGVSTPSYLELIREAYSMGATAVSTEFLCVEERSLSGKKCLEEISKVAGLDLLEFYRKYSNQNGYKRLNRKIKAPFMFNMKQLCDELGMRFYVSDAHFKELSCNGSCCGLGENWNYSRGQFTQALLLCKRKGEVRWSEIKEDIDKLHSKYRWARAIGYNQGSTEARAKFDGMSMADWLHWLWNNPQSGDSPYRLFGGVMVPTDNDENGDIVYKFNKERTIDV